MSYGSDRPDIWSSCSDTDMLTWWKEEGHECVNTRDIVDGKLKLYLCKCSVLKIWL